MRLSNLPKHLIDELNEIIKFMPTFDSAIYLRQTGKEERKKARDWIHILAHKKSYFKDRTINRKDLILILEQAGKIIHGEKGNMSQSLIDKWD